jgi:hypothetical protein
MPRKPHIHVESNFNAGSSSEIHLLDLRGHTSWIGTNILGGQRDHWLELVAILRAEDIGSDRRLWPGTGLESMEDQRLVHRYEVQAP